MECSLFTCKNLALEAIYCEKCLIPKYCSDLCRQADLAFHTGSCRPHIYTLKDFIPVKDSQKILGKGTYGEVQLVQKFNSKEFFALKIIKKASVSSLVPLKVLFREISIHKALDHPNIVKLIDHLEDRLKIYLVLEYVDKGSLFDLIHKKIKLKQPEACSIFTQICVGINYLHNNSLVHRDLKPENVLISNANVIKICDFGWSAQGDQERVTFCGTLDYMSPEMLRKLPHTFKVDIWALGILLYEMLHGSPPFKAKNPKEMSRIISESTYVLGNYISDHAKVLIQSILQEDPSSRPSINDILKSDWVQEFSENKIQKDWKIIHPSLGEGIVHNTIGLICFVHFSGIEEEMIEHEIIRLYPVFNLLNQRVFNSELLISPIEPGEISLSSNLSHKNLKACKSNSPVIKSAIKNLSNKKSFKTSIINTPKAEAHVTFSFLNKESASPKAPNFFEETKKTPAEQSKKEIKHDFEGINLLPDLPPLLPEPKTRTPKSKFLSKWNSGLRPNN